MNHGRPLRMGSAVAVLSVAALAASCGETVAARAQLLIFVDTNAPLTASSREVGQLAVDTLRVDLIAPDGSVDDFLDVVAPEPDGWPLSFGVVPDDVDGVPVLIRLRLFGGAHAHRGENQGLTTIEPEPTSTIDRLVAVPFPARGIRKVGVLMDSDCVGSPASFAGAPVSCRSGDAPRVDPGEAFVDLTEDWTDTRADTWEAARSAPCRGAQPEGAVCIPGGAGVLGEAQLAAPLTDGIAPAYPLVPVVMTPFWMDRTEFTVGRLRRLVEQELYSGTMPELHDPEHTVQALCSWLGPEDAAHDELPVNCLPPTAAEAVCRAVAGRLPSEARWEFAARGRGAGWLFPWGNAFAECCSASLSRLGASVETAASCPGGWLSSVGSYSDPDACEGPVDRTPDGVLDLAGSLAEATLDAWVPFGTECWAAPGLRRDPVCPVEAGFVVRRGGDWSGGMGLARSTLRSRQVATLGNVTLGFRCVYEDAP